MEYLTMKAIICHSGVSSVEIPLEKAQLLQKIVMDAAKAGVSILENSELNKNCVDAVEEAIRLMESSGISNAGRGAVRQQDGKQRMDASIMYSKNLETGSVASLRGILHPISVARLIMQSQKFCNLAFDEAYKLAKEHNLEELSELNAVPGPLKKETKNQKNMHGTVGAVCLDENSDLCAGTSTGGLVGATPGRIGDTPIIGAGTYCNEFAGASLTGVGEYNMKILGAKRVIDLIQYQKKMPQEAADQLIKEFTEKFSVSLGVIVLNNKGEYGVAFQGKAMPWLVIQEIKGNNYLSYGLRKNEIVKKCF